MNRICSKCKIQKDISEFYKYKSDYQRYCKSCQISYLSTPKSKQKKKEWRDNNPDYDKLYAKKHEKRIKTNKHMHYEEHKEEINKKAKIYRDNNPEKMKTQSSRYYREHRSERLIYGYNYLKNRRTEDDFFKFSDNLKTLIRMAIKQKGYSKKSRSFQIIGESFEFVWQYLIMTAIGNYGFYDESIVYHIDHKIPCSLAETEEELIKLQHYTNLQFLTPKDNLSKSDKLDWNFKEDLKIGDEI